MEVDYITNSLSTNLLKSSTDLSKHLCNVCPYIHRTAYANTPV